MSAGNPLKNLDKVIELARAGQLPPDAERWAESAARTAEEILATIKTMRKSGAVAPTFGQQEALGNIYAAARRWIKAVRPAEDPPGA
jgi:hypothetical protein